MSIRIYESADLASLSFNLSRARGAWSTSYSGRHSSWKGPSVTLNSRLGGLQHKSGGFGEEINLLSLRGGSYNDS